MSIDEDVFELVLLFYQGNSDASYLGLLKMIMHLIVIPNERFDKRF